MSMTARPNLSLEEMNAVAKGIGSGKSPSGALHDECTDDIVARDDITGDALDPKLMARARKEEMAYFRQMGVYDKVDINEAWNVTGKAPIAVRWVDINKGDSRAPNYRSR